MPQITYILADGTEQIADVPIGWTLMEGAVKNGLRGILADCGGACTCATCQIMLPEQWVGRIPAATDSEQEMLEFAADRQANSRLSCQIAVTGEMDGLAVRLPRSQLG